MRKPLSLLFSVFLLPSAVVMADNPMVPIEGGEYTLGTNNGRYDEKPPIKVTVSPFQINRYEVSNEEFQRFVTGAKHRPDGPWQRGFTGKDLPVRYVSWHDAKVYCESSGAQLPTAAQWEIAAGEQRFPWGEDWQTLSRQVRSVSEKTADVSKAGVYGLSGNVREWTRDWYDRYGYAALAGKIVHDPVGPADGTKAEQKFIDTNTNAGNERSTRKVVKGGSWFAKSGSNATKYRRWSHNPEGWYQDVGFRCVRSKRNG